MALQGGWWEPLVIDHMSKHIKTKNWQNHERCRAAGIRSTSYLFLDYREPFHSRLITKILLNAAASISQELKKGCDLQYVRRINTVIYQDQSPAQLLTFLAHKFPFWSSAQFWEQPTPLIKRNLWFIFSLHFDDSSTLWLLLFWSTVKPSILLKSVLQFFCQRSEHAVPFQWSWNTERERNQPSTLSASLCMGS